MSKVVFKSEVKWTGSGVQCDAQSGPHTIRIDEPESLGGSNTGANPVELLLSALGGCLVVLVNAFAESHGVIVDDVKVHVEGDLDPRGFMGKADVRPGFSAIRYKLEVESQSDPTAVNDLVEHAEKACPVKDTLSGVSITRL